MKPLQHCVCGLPVKEHFSGRRKLDCVSALRRSVLLRPPDLGQAKELQLVVGNRIKR